MNMATTKEWLGKNRIRTICAGLVLGLFLLLQIDAVHDFGAKLIGEELNHQNVVYLKHAEHEARRTFIKLSEIYAVMRVIESGKVGISIFVETEVTIGRAMSSFVDLVERGIVVSLAAAAASASLKQLIALIEMLNPLLFKLTLLFGGAYLIVSSFSRKHWLTSTSRGLCEIVVLVFLTTYLIIPYSIHATGWLGQQLTAEIKHNTNERLNNLHHDITRHRVDKSDHGKSAKHAMSRFDKFAVNIKHKIESMTLILIRHIATALIEGILLPLGLVLVLFYGIKRIAKQVGRIYETDLSEVKQTD